MSEKEQQESMPSVYEIQVRGHLDQRWADWFGGMAFTHGNDGTTTLRGIVADQAALYGLLNGIKNLGLPLVSVQQMSSNAKEKE